MAGAFNNDFSNAFDIEVIPPSGGDNDRNTRRGVGMRYRGLRRGGKFAFLVGALYLWSEAAAAVASQVVI